MSTISFLAKQDSVSLPAGFFLLTYDLNGLNHLSLELIGTFTLWVLSKQPFYYAFHLFLFLFHALQLFSFLKKTNFPDNLKKHKSKTIPKNSILFKTKHDFKNKI